MTDAIPTPRTDALLISTLGMPLHKVFKKCEETARQLERDLIEANDTITGLRADYDAERDSKEMYKARAEKAERTVAWLRSGHDFVICVDVNNDGEDFYERSEVDGHLASNPPEDWKP